MIITYINTLRCRKCYPAFFRIASSDNHISPHFPKLYQVVSISRNRDTQYPTKSFWKRMGGTGGRRNLFAEKGFSFPP